MLVNFVVKFTNHSVNRAVYKKSQFMGLFMSKKGEKKQRIEKICMILIKKTFCVGKKIVIMTKSYWTECTKNSRKNWKVFTLTRSNLSGKLSSWGNRLRKGCVVLPKCMGQGIPRISRGCRLGGALASAGRGFPPGSMPARLGRQGTE